MTGDKINSKEEGPSPASLPSQAAVFTFVSLVPQSHWIISARIGPTQGACGTHPDTLMKLRIVWFRLI